MTRGVLFKRIFKAIKLQNLILILLIVSVMAMKFFNYGVILSIIYTVVLVSATQLGSAQYISRKAFEKSIDIVCDDLYLAYDNKLRLMVQIYLISVENDVLKQINCIIEDDIILLENISSSDLNSSFIKLKGRRYTLIKMK